MLVFLFILFEEIIWEGIAKPIYKHIESLRILQKLEEHIMYANRYLVLVIFVVLLLGVEGAGLLAGLFFVQGKALLGLLLYVTKIPIAAFTFWLFKVSRIKLLSFDWFNWSYMKLMAGIAWLKNLDIYKKTVTYMFDMKFKIKEKWNAMKEKYFSKESSFVAELKAFYSYIKNFKNRKKKEQND
ncbi:hypothetical protein KKC13_03875 [bacterium]|nr:hypothetical protein [bacterium]MBU1957192.1 hypothetical protein [bacterium]